MLLVSSNNVINAVEEVNAVQTKEVKGTEISSTSNDWESAEYPFNQIWF